MTSSQPPFRRAIVIVMDSVGIGELPDARSYGDEGSNTVGNIAKQIPLKIPALRSLGLDRLVDLGGHTGPPLQPVVGADLRVGPCRAESTSVSPLENVRSHIAASCAE